MNPYPTEFERPSAPIEGRFAWTANDLERDDSWRISLDASHIEGLEQALAFAGERGITTFHEDAAQVPLSGWETLIPHIRDSGRWSWNGVASWLTDRAVYGRTGLSHLLVDLIAPWNTHRSKRSRRVNW